MTSAQYVFALVLAFTVFCAWMNLKAGERWIAKYTLFWVVVFTAWLGATAVAWLADVWVDRLR